MSLALWLGLAAGTARAQPPAPAQGTAPAKVAAPAQANIPAQASAPAELSPELRRFADECETLRRGTILKLEEAQRGLRSGTVNVKNRPAAERQVAADLAALRARERLVTPSLRFPPTKGQIGRLPEGGAHVERISGPNEMLVQCTFRVPVVVIKHYRPVGEVVKRSMVCKIRGVSTADASESNDLPLPQVFRVTGSESYRTADGGSSEALVLVPVDLRPIESYLRQRSTP